MFVRAKPVPDPAVQAEVVERVDMGAGVAVHREGRAGVAGAGVQGIAHAHRIVDFGAAWCMRHPELVVRIARALPAGHADVVVGGQVVGAAAVDARQDRGAGFGRDQVEAADFIVGAPRAGADFAGMTVDRGGKGGGQQCDQGQAARGARKQRVHETGILLGARPGTGHRGIHSLAVSPARKNAARVPTVFTTGYESVSSSAGNAPARNSTNTCTLGGRCRVVG